MKLQKKISLHIIPLILIILIGFNIMLLKFFEHREKSRALENMESFLEHNFTVLINDMRHDRNFIERFSSALINLSIFYNYDIAIIDRNHNPVISTLEYEIFDDLKNDMIEVSHEGLNLLKEKRADNRIVRLYYFLHSNKGLFVYLSFHPLNYSYSALLIPLLLIIIGQSAFIFIMIIFIINRGILKPIFELEKLSESISELKFDGLTKYEFQKDEFGGLYCKMERMKSTLKKARDELLSNFEAQKATNKLLKDTQKQLILSERWGLIGKLSSSIAHEIGNPLMGITGYLDLLKTGSNTEDEIREYLEGMELEINRIQNLIYSLLNIRSYEKLEILKYRPYDEIIKIKKILLISKEFRDKGLSIHIHGEESRHIEIIQYKEFFRHIVFNLLHNAGKFSPQGSQIDINIDKIDQNLRMTIRDYGKGIMDNSYDSIFSNAPKDTDSTGLGLYLSRLFAEYMHGHLYCMKPFGKGASFVLFVPVKIEGD